jgi:hypothetical protein
VADERTAERAGCSAAGVQVVPIRDANAPAYKHLEQLVRLVAERHDAEMSTPPKPIGPPSDFGKDAKPPAKGDGPPKDEFDPEVFNRMSKGKG